MKRIGLVLIVLLALIPASFPAAACSGGPLFEDVFELWPTLVYAEVMKTDAHGQNAILRVHEVLAGAAHERVLLVRNEPGQTVGVAEGVLGNGDCNFIEAPLIEGDAFYIHLRHELHGGYSGGWVYRFDVEPVSEDSGFQPVSARWENEDAFRAEIAQISGMTPHAPTPLAVGLPRLAPLHIGLDDGTSHLLPVDSDTPVLLDTLALQQEAEYGFWHQYFPAFAEDSMGCLPPDCVLSPDGAYLVRGKPTWLEVRFGDPVDAESWALSPNGGLLATAYKDAITLYRLPYLRTGNLERTTALYTSIPRAADSPTSPQFQWSADGRRLAFTDGAGLWVWEVYTSDAPVLILGRDAGGGLPSARAFSPLGNYVEVLLADSVFWMEAQPDGGRLPWGFWSPDEVMLLAQVAEDIMICPAIAPDACISASMGVMNTGGDVSVFYRLLGAAWHTPYHLTYWACDVGSEECAAIEVNLEGYSAEDLAYPEPRVSQFVYQQEVDQLAVVYDRGLFIDGRPVWEDANARQIIGLRWLRPLWSAD